MSEAAHKETLSFQAEAQQLLQLMIHSLYSEKEIFLRELISNASDACDKLRFEALADDQLYEGDGELAIHITVDKDARTLTVRDNGIGMTRQEVIDNLGTIARSGTKQFLESLTGDKAKDAKLIGQFGVGFYSAFIVADKVTVLTRRAGEPANQGVRWESDGKGSYELETVDYSQRGTEVTLHLKAEETEFLEDYRLRHIITKYSNHISLPIRMLKAPEGEDEQPSDEWETVNQASALWTRTKKDISDEEYREFYKHIAHDFDEPLSWLHNHVEGTQSYTSLFYIPKRAPFDLYDRDHRHGIKLYVRRVFIMDDAEHLMPQYLRFVRGLVDSDDLPLNVSREILQRNKQIDSIRAASVKKVLAHLEKLSKDDAEAYQTFWEQFGKVLKEGPAEDFANREAIAKLLRFASTHNDSDAQTVSLADYIARMKEGQEKIYFITADSVSAGKSSPHMEVFRKKGIEVLLLTDRVDEWLVSHLTEFDGKKLQSIAKGDLDLGKLEDEQEKQAAEESAKQHEDLLKKMQDALGDKVKQVRVSHRLTDSPSCLVVEEQDMAVNLQNLLKQAGHEVPTVQPILEVNLEHPLLKLLETQKDQERFEDWTHILFDQAMLSEGGQLDNPSEFVQRLNQLLLQLT